ncbi:MAG: cytidylyltransferase domain-containing protein [Nitrospiria bacterium]
MKTGIIVQARMGSTRLPGKVLLRILGKPLLQLQIERLKRIPEVDQIIIATTLKEEEKPIVELVESLDGVDLFRGSETDVLDRYYQAALFFKLDTVVRITSDCPLIDPEVVYRVLKKYIDLRGKVDYVSNVFPRTYPRGLDTEVFSFKALETAYKESTLSPDREHVTPYIWRQPPQFRLANVSYESDLSHLRWTVDMPEDFELINKIYVSIYPLKSLFCLKDCLDLLKSHPDWEKINSNIEQKSIHDEYRYSN